MATADRIAEIAREISAALAPVLNAEPKPRKTLTVDPRAVQATLLLDGAGVPETMGYHTQEVRFMLLVVLPSSVSGDLARADGLAARLASTDGLYTLNKAQVRSRARIEDVDVDYFAAVGDARATLITATITAWG